MKVFQAIPNPYSSLNQYVMTLMDGIDAQHNDVEWGWGIEKFWQADIMEYDIIHIHWPETLLWINRTTQQIEKRILKLKKLGKKIVVTCHNLEPHYCTNVNIHQTYNIIYTYCDIMIHLGTYSYELMKIKYPNTKHVKSAHHIYDSFYTFYPTKEESCQKLNIHQDREYILCFGAFRDEEEREMIKDVAKTFIGGNKYILAPSFRQITLNGRRERIKAYFKKKNSERNHIINSGLANSSTPNDITPYYYGASSIALIQRKKILNSGNVPLAFLMGKVVVGPNEGNVGLLLSETGNPSFDINDNKSIIGAINKAFELTKENYGEKNRKYALDNFSSDIISNSLYNYYKSILIN